MGDTVSSMVSMVSRSLSEDRLEGEGLEKGEWYDEEEEELDDEGEESLEKGEEALDCL